MSDPLEKIAKLCERAEAIQVQMTITEPIELLRDRQRWGYGCDVAAFVRDVREVLNAI